MNDTPTEPSGDEAEWDGLFRSLRLRARDLAREVSDPQDFAALVDAVETLSGIDPTFPGSVVFTEVSGDDVPPEGEGDEEDGGEGVPAAATN